MREFKVNKIKKYLYHSMIGKIKFKHKLAMFTNTMLVYSPDFTSTMERLKKISCVVNPQFNS